jgi:glycosyltransferase involved in cell wall biosynthesis
VKIDRVVILSDISWPLGGGELVALMTARLMAAAGLPVTFIAGDDAAKCPLDRDQIEVIALGGAALADRGLLNRAVAGLHNADAQRRIAEFIATRDTPRTVYHVHNWSQILSPAAFRALRPVADRLFFSAHDFSLVCPTLSYADNKQAGAACGRKPLGPSCVTAHCDRGAYTHKLWSVGRSVALKLALDFERSRPLVGIIHPGMIEWYERGGIPRERIRVLRNAVNPFSKTRIEAERNADIFFIGRVVHEKGVDLAAEAARMTGRRLRVIGDGDARASLAERYPDVVFEGFRNHAQISALIKEARAVVVPSRLPEMFTLVAHEAMRSGVPVVAFSDVDGQEMADLGGAIVVPPREASSLAGGLRRLDDDAVVARMSRICFEEGWRFSNTTESWRDALIGHFSELIEQTARGPVWRPRAAGSSAGARIAPAAQPAPRI